MATSSYTIRDDSQYTVIVGWKDELQSFFARVYDHIDADGEPLLAVGQEPRQIGSLSHLTELLARYASLDVETVSALRHDAVPMR